MLLREHNQYENESECEDYEDYGEGGYYPASLGECLHGKYSIIQKLGWGRFSTVWLAETQQPYAQFALKIQRCDEKYLDNALAEIRLLKKLRECEFDSRWISLIDCGFNINELQEQQTHEKEELLQAYRPLTLYDSFLINGINGKHLCGVFELMGPTLLNVMSHYEEKNLYMPIDLVKRITKDILIQLVYMHDIAHITHGDLKPENILMKLSPEEEEKFVEGLREYKVKPVSMKFLQEIHEINPNLFKNSSKNDSKITVDTEKNLSYTRQLSHKNKKHQPKQSWQLDSSSSYTDPDQSSFSHTSFSEDEQEKPQQIPEDDIDILHWKNVNIDLRKQLRFKICDFGNAELAYQQEGLIQTRQFRSPQIIIGHPYCPNADIWSLGCIVFEMLTNSFLFKPDQKANISKDEDHLYLMMEILGQMPKSFVTKGLHWRQFFTETAKLKNGNPKERLTIRKILIEDFGYKTRQARQIEQFLLPMLQYEPSKRASAAECLKSKWLWTQN